MKIRSTLLAFGIAATLTGCQNMDSNALLSSGAEAFQAYSLSDEQVKTLSDQACKEMDAKATISPASSEYSKRLSKIAAALGDNINGQPVNYKVYETKDVNAFAMANGCIRVYSGLMNLMNDNEVEAVIGHEMGHVALGHVKKGMQVALGTNAVRAAAASAGGIVGSLSQSQLGDLGEKLVNSQFSQRQESEADDYSYDLLRKRGINPSGLATSFEKLAKLEAGRQSSMFDDHPASEARAQFPTIAKRVYEDNIEVTVIKGSKPYVKIVPIDDNASDGENGTMYLDAYLEAADEYRDLFEALSK